MTAASMALERQNLETGIIQSPTILMASSTVWRCLPWVQTLAFGQMSIAACTTLSSATTVSSVTKWLLNRGFRQCANSIYVQMVFHWSWNKKKSTPTFHLTNHQYNFRFTKWNSIFCQNKSKPYLAWRSDILQEELCWSGKVQHTLLLLLWLHFYIWLLYFLSFMSSW